MAVDNEAVKQIAYLARLGVEEDKLEETQREFNKILAWVEELGEVDTNGVEPMFSPHEENILLRNDELMKLFRETCHKHGILCEVDECFGYLHEFPEKYEQMSLF